MMTTQRSLKTHMFKAVQYFDAIDFKMLKFYTIVNYPTFVVSYGKIGRIVCSFQAQRCIPVFTGYTPERKRLTVDNI